MNNNKNRFISSLKAFNWGYVLIFLILTALGVLSFCFHDMLKWVVFTAGAIISLLGVSFGIAALVKKERGPKFTFRIVVCVSALVCGIITMIFAKSGIEVLTAILGTMFIIDGAFKLQKTGMLRQYKSVAWWILLIPALLSVVGGFMLVKFGSVSSENDMLFVAILLGASAIIDGISNLLTAIFNAFSGKKRKENANEPDTKNDGQPSEVCDATDEGASCKDETCDALIDEIPPVSDAPQCDDAAPLSDSAQDQTGTECDAPEDQSASEPAPVAADAQNSTASDFKIDIPVIEIHDEE